MKHDLIHIQGKPYVLVPLHEYRSLTGPAQNETTGDLPEDVLDRLFAGQESPVKIIRKFRGLTQVDLSNASGLSRPYLAEIETGRKQGSVEALRILAQTLGVPINFIIKTA